MVKPRECSLEQDLLLCWPEPLRGWGWPGGWQGLRGWKGRQDRSVLAVDRSVLTVDSPAAGLTLHTLPCWLGTASSPFPKPTGSTGFSLWVWVRPSCPPPPCAAPTGVTEPTGSVMVWAEMRSVGLHCGSMGSLFQQAATRVGFVPCLYQGHICGQAAKQLYF